MPSYPSTDIELSDSYQRRGIIATATATRISEHGEDLTLDIELEIEHMTYKTSLERRDRTWAIAPAASDDPQATRLNAGLKALARRHRFDLSRLRNRLEAELEAWVEEDIG